MKSMQYFIYNGAEKLGATVVPVTSASACQRLCSRDGSIGSDLGDY
jgi:hypothetical protein